MPGMIGEYGPQAAATIGALPYLWMKLKAMLRNFRRRNDKDAVEGHRVIWK